MVINFICQAITAKKKDVTCAKMKRTCLNMKFIASYALLKNVPQRVLLRL